MFNVRVSSIAAAAAFILSLLIGLIGGAGFPAVLVRALIFGASFFAFAAVSDSLISRFLPELFGSEAPPTSEGDAAESESPGANVDLSVGDDTDALPVYTRYAANAADGPNAVVEEEASNLEDAGLDHGDEAGYTEPAAVFSAVQKDPAKPPELIGDVDDLPDLEGLSDAFVSPIDIGDDVEGHAPVAAASRGASSERFDAKEMAMAIQTILKRDQKG